MSLCRQVPLCQAKFAWSAHDPLQPYSAFIAARGADILRQWQYRASVAVEREAGWVSKKG